MTELERQTEEYIAEIRAALALDPTVRQRAIEEAERCRQSCLYMVAHGCVDIMHAERDKNTYEAIRRALQPETELPQWGSWLSISTHDSDDTVRRKVVAAGYEPPRPRPRTQLWEPCPHCGQEPIYLETGCCKDCSADD